MYHICTIRLIIKEIIILALGVLKKVFRIFESERNVVFTDTRKSFNLNNPISIIYIIQIY